MDEPIAVIGIGDDGPAGLSVTARDRLNGAELLVGGRRHLAFFPEWTGRTITITGDLDGLIDRLRNEAAHHRVAVLASGDPLFYGIGRRLLQHFSLDRLAFIPHVSSVQLAFARLKIPHDDARTLSVHGRSLDRIHPPLQHGEDKLAVLTDPTNDPAAVARYVYDLGLGEVYELWVCENLGGEAERITGWSPAEAVRQEFSPLNVTVLLKRNPKDNDEADRSQDNAATASAPPLIGLPDEAIEHAGQHRGQITKQETRLITLARLALRPGDRLWDVGAGSGAVSVEAARLSPELEVIACERSAERCRLIRANLERFNLANVQLIEDEAPEALTDAPAPDAVFVGGSGGRMHELLPAVLDRLNPGGRLVIACITIETLSAAWSLLRDRGLEPGATSLQVAHAQPIGPMHRFEPQTPITLLHTTRP